MIIDYRTVLARGSEFAIVVCVAWGAFRRRFHRRAWLLPIRSVGILLLLAILSSGIIEGRYVNPIHPILLAAAIVLYVG